MRTSFALAALFGTSLANLETDSTKLTYINKFEVQGPELETGNGQTLSAGYMTSWKIEGTKEAETLTQFERQSIKIDGETPLGSSDKIQICIMLIDSGVDQGYAYDAYQTNCSEITSTQATYQKLYASGVKVLPEIKDAEALVPQAFQSYIDTQDKEIAAAVQAGKTPEPTVYVMANQAIAFNNNKKITKSGNDSGLYGIVAADSNVDVAKQIDLTFFSKLNVEENKQQIAKVKAGELSWPAKQYLQHSVAGGTLKTKSADITIAMAAEGKGTEVGEKDGSTSLSFMTSFATVATAIAMLNF